VVTAERVFLEVERLAVLADEPVSDEIRQTYRPQLKEVLRDLEAALATRAEDLLAGIPGSEHPAEGIPRRDSCFCGRNMPVTKLLRVSLN
jgi:hypothetical protein